MTPFEFLPGLRPSDPETLLVRGVLLSLYTFVALMWVYL